MLPTVEEEVNKRVSSRDKNHDEKWEKYHRPNEDGYILEDKPQKRADFVVYN